jgi:hypothetical protein
MADFAADRGLDVEQVKRASSEVRDLAQRYGEFATDAALAAGGALPPPAGTAADAASLARSVAKGDWWGAAFDLVGFVPLAGDAVKGGRVAWKLRDLGRMVDELTVGLGRTMDDTAEAATDFWRSTRNMPEYRRALEACDGTTKCLDAAALKKGKQYKSTPKSGNGGNWNPPDGRGDGEWVPDPDSPLAEAIAPRTSVTYENGFPKFDDFSKGEIRIPQTGNSGHDLDLADELFKKDNPGWERPEGYTWHHKEDGTTMQLVPSAVNNNAGHAGGQALFAERSTGREF